MMVAWAGFEPRSPSKQNYSSLPPPIHHPPKVRAATCPKLTPHPSTQFDPDPATSPSNPRFGVPEVVAAKLEPRDAVPRTVVHAVIQTVIQNRALADRC